MAKANVVTAQAAPAAVATTARVVTSQDAPAKAKAKAVTSQDAPAKAKAQAPKAKAAPAVPAGGARAQRIALSAHLDNAKIIRMGKPAKKQGYDSHTDRWRRQPGYADQCRAKVPPDPEWLVYADGTTARIDGERGDAFPPGR